MTLLVQKQLGPKARVWPESLQEPHPFLQLWTDEEESLMAMQCVLFIWLKRAKHVWMVLGNASMAAHYDFLWYQRQEYWLYPHSSLAAALALLADVPDRRQYLLPTMEKDAPASYWQAGLRALVYQDQPEQVHSIAQRYWSSMPYTQFDGPSLMFSKIFPWGTMRLGYGKMI
jgi:hypothetical protein